MTYSDITFDKFKDISCHFKEIFRSIKPNLSSNSMNYHINHYKSIIMSHGLCESFELEKDRFKDYLIITYEH